MRYHPEQQRFISVCLASETTSLLALHAILVALTQPSDDASRRHEVISLCHNVNAFFAIHLYHCEDHLTIIPGLPEPCFTFLVSKWLFSFAFISLAESVACSSHYFRHALAFSGPRKSSWTSQLFPSHVLRPRGVSGSSFAFISLYGLTSAHSCTH